MWTRLRLRFAALVRRTRFERDLADELAFHVQARAEEWEGGGCRRQRRAGGRSLSWGAQSASRKRCGTSGSAGGWRCSGRISTTGSACCAPIPASRPSALCRWLSAWPSASTSSRGSTPVFWRRSRELGIRIRWLLSTRGCRMRLSSVSASRTTSSKRRRRTWGLRRSASPSTASKAPSASSAIWSRRSTSRHLASRRPPVASFLKGPNGRARSR